MRMHGPGLVPHRPAPLVLIVLACLSLTTAPGPAAAAPTGGSPAAREALGPFPGSRRADRILVKFVEDKRVRLRGAGVLTSLAGADLEGMAAFLARHPEVRVARHFVRQETELDATRARGEAATARVLPDLNSYYRLELGGTRSAETLAGLLAELRSLSEVELAYLEPIAEPAALGFAGGTPASLVTPDFTSLQDYLDPAPLGVGAASAWAVPGGRGAGIRVLDIEGAWRWTHEDLPSPFFTGGTPIADAAWRNHGTAVVGVMRGSENGFGVTGIAPEIAVGGVSIQDMATSSAIDLAASQLAPGDLYLIELHAPGPNANGQGQFGYVPMEYWQDVFDAISTATAGGVACIEAAGNGQQNLDDAVYEGRFDRQVRDSGAVLVGAAVGATGDPEWFTNHGSRVNVHGWGSLVVTTGYGNLQGGSEDQWYTSSFAGTSSATPVVAGSAAALQGAHKAATARVLAPELLREILAATGTPQAPSPKHVGPRPNLGAAIPALSQLATLNGVVTSTSQGDALGPVAGARVSIDENGIGGTTGPGGAYSFELLGGGFTATAVAFGFTPASQPFTVAPGGTRTLNFGLARTPAGSLAGTVVEVAGPPLSGVQVRVLDTPLTPAITGLLGRYAFPSIPVGEYVTVADVGGYGPGFETVGIVANQTVTRDFQLVPAETFEASGGGFTAAGEWEWGMPQAQGGPASAHGGARVWGTDLDATYDDGVVSTLVTRDFDLAGLARMQHPVEMILRPRLAVWHWLRSEAAFDGGNVAISTDGGATFTLIAPIGGYTDAALDGLGGEPGLSGGTADWEPLVFSLDPYINRTVRFRFRFGADSSVHDKGWFIDDLAVGGPTSVAVSEAGAPALALELGPAYPNPFNPSTTIPLALGAPGPVRLRVFDVGGRLVRVLADGPLAAGRHPVRWDGLDATGRRAPSGAYFLRFDAGSRTETLPLVLVR